MHAKTIVVTKADRSKFIVKIRQRQLGKRANSVYKLSNSAVSSYRERRRFVTVYKQPRTPSMYPIFPKEER